MTRLLSTPLLVLPMVVLVTGCERGNQDVVAVGTIERERVELIAEASEPIVGIAVREGQGVTAGEPILTLDPRRMTAEVMRAKGARDRIMARLSELERGPRSELIEEAKAAVSGSKGILDRDRRELQRARSLNSQGVLSQSEKDGAQAALESSLAQYERALAELSALETGTTLEELDQARAAVAEAQGALEVARIRLERMTVRAPIDGRVDALPFELGEQPPAGAVVAVMLANSAPYARVYVPEPIRVRVSEGTTARVEIDGIDREFSARVRTIAAEAAFTPFFALTEKDRGRLAYLAELDLEEEEARDLPTGVPARARFDFDDALPSDE